VSYTIQLQLTVKEEINNQDIIDFRHKLIERLNTDKNKNMESLDDILKRNEELMLSSAIAKQKYLELKNKLYELENLWKDERKLVRSNIQKLEQYSPYRLGQKVIVLKSVNVGNTIRPNFVDSEGFISKIIPRLSSQNKMTFEYKCNAVKKDGTMSSKALRFKRDTYGEDEIKSIN